MNDVDAFLDASLACNYSDLATDDGGNCVYPEPWYNCDGLCVNDADGDGICDELENPGCTDLSACNFEALATDDDGSCLFLDALGECGGSCEADADMDGICDCGASGSGISSWSKSMRPRLCRGQSRTA